MAKPLTVNDLVKDPGKIVRLGKDHALPCRRCGRLTWNTYCRKCARQMKRKRG